ncbi:MAG: aminopeptidase N [Lautropia sp.]|nr:aminopeptidase N [Lautropia sp.]
MRPAVTIRRSDYRPPDYLTPSVHLRFELDPERTIVTSSARFVRRPDAAPGAALRLDGEGLELLACRLDGEDLDKSRYIADEDGLLLQAPPAEFELTTVVAVAPAGNLQLSGLYASRGMLLTQCEAQGFRRITYFQDRPDVMARYRVELHADPDRFPVLLSNGNLVETRREGERHVAVWDDPFPKPSYLFALVAGRLEANELTHPTRSGREVTLQVWVEPGNMSKTEHAMESLKRAIGWDEDRFDLELDLDRFMIVATSDFNMGAMENKGLNIFNAKYLFANPRIATDEDFARVESIVGHEYFHNWTGNRVTCRDWFQLTLKEGLTVFRDQEFSADLLAAELGEGSPAAVSARAVHRIETVRVLRATQFAEDAGPMAHPIRPDSYQAIDNFYTSTVYEKGAEVIRMLQTLVGVDGFRKGMALYFQRHDGQAVTCDDFVAAIADANGRDLGRFMRWYSTAGTPLILVVSAFDAAAGRYSLIFRQHLRDADGRTVPATGSNPSPLQIPVALGLLDRCGREILATTVELTDGEQRLDFEGLGSEPIPSLLRGFSAPVIVKYDYSDDDLAFLLAHDTDPFNRWEACQQLIVRAIVQTMERAPGAPEPAGRSVAPSTALLGRSLHSALMDARLDDGLRNQLLALPSEGFLTEQLDDIDPVALRAARNQVRTELAHALREPLQNFVAGHHWKDPYRLSVTAGSRRALANAALLLLNCQDLPDAADLAQQQFDAANNMTDRLGALQALLLTTAERRDAALAAFAREYADEAGVMDKWFMLQATMHCLPGTPPVLDRVLELTRHPAYSASNPNKVRSLMNAFCTGNLAEFHRADGRGYDLWAQQVLSLDQVNPQVAARLARALDRHTKFIAPLREKMHAALARVAQNCRSTDVREIVDRSLGASRQPSTATP